MSGLGWIVVGVLAVGLVFLGLVLVAAVRQLDELRERLAALEAGRAPAGGLPVGGQAPPIEGAALGVRRLVAFVEASCEACEALVPELLTARDLPPTALVVTGRTEAPASWRGGERAGVELVRDPGGALAAAYQTDLTPHVFVVDETAHVVAQGPAGSASDVRALLRGAEGVRIVGSAGE